MGENGFGVGDAFPHVLPRWRRHAGTSEELGSFFSGDSMGRGLFACSSPAALGLNLGWIRTPGCGWAASVLPTDRCRGRRARAGGCGDARRAAQHLGSGAKGRGRGAGLGTRGAAGTAGRAARRPAGWGGDVPAATPRAAPRAACGSGRDRAAAAAEAAAVKNAPGTRRGARFQKLRRARGGRCECCVRR